LQEPDGAMCQKTAFFILMETLHVQLTLKETKYIGRRILLSRKQDEVEKVKM
jgi:hypothetical protein